MGDTARRSDRVHGWAAGLARGPAEVLDFLLPLWAGAALGLSPTAIGVLVAAETFVSFLVRPVAGVLADRLRRTRVAAAGAMVSAASLAGYATATGFPTALLAAVVGGAGGALFWVALRARVAQDAPEDPAVFARLFSAEGTGTWVAFVAALTLLPRIDASGVFLGGAAACVVAAAVLAVAGDDAATAPAPAGGWGPATRRLRPLLLVVGVIAAAEGAVSLVLLLHLQHRFALDVGEIALVFLPGFVVYSLAPEYLHGVVGRIGRRRAMTVAPVCSGVFALTLAWAPTVWVIAVAWVLAAASFAVAVPIEQAVVAETSGLGPGRAMAVYETATLAGVTVGVLAAGPLYDTGGLVVVCLAAAVLLTGIASMARRALGRVGAADRPVPAGTSGTGPPPGSPVPEPDRPTRGGDRPPAAPGPAAGGATASRPSARGWYAHLGVYVVAQAGLAVAGLSWPVEALLSGPHPAEWFWNTSGDLLLDAGRIWTLVLVLDGAWSVGRMLLSRRRAAPGPGAPSRPGR
ncbi:MFS transporter [Pseudonocardia alni]|uniref:MFS transporter n=1 Tax=Pseudonocardia alni TaxID=33907 RepID=UPI003407661E